MLIEASINTFRFAEDDLMSAVRFPSIIKIAACHTISKDAP